MNRLNLIWIAFISICITFSCSNEQPDINEPSNSEVFKKNSNGSVTVPFKAEFYTKKNVQNSLEVSCDDLDYPNGNYQAGEGNATHLGKFTTVITFCEGAGGFYRYGEGVFVAANGDELYFTIEGQVLLTFDDTFYEAYFTDPFEITGGTGRFENASGGGMTDSWVNLSENGWIWIGDPPMPVPDGFIPEFQTDHKLTGELNFFPGKSKLID